MDESRRRFLKSAVATTTIPVVPALLNSCATGDHDSCSGQARGCEDPGGTKDYRCTCPCHGGQLYCKLCDQLISATEAAEHEEKCRRYEVAAATSGGKADVTDPKLACKHIQRMGAGDPNIPVSEGVHCEVVKDLWWCPDCGALGFAKSCAVYVSDGAMGFPDDGDPVNWFKPKREWLRYEDFGNRVLIGNNVFSRTFLEHFADGGAFLLRREEERIVDRDELRPVIMATRMQPLRLPEWIRKRMEQRLPTTLSGTVYYTT